MLLNGMCTHWKDSFAIDTIKPFKGTGPYFSFISTKLLYNNFPSHKKYHLDHSNP